MGERKAILSAPEAAALLGVPVQKLRVRMQAKVWDLGVVYKPPGERRRYDIFRYKLEKFMEGNKHEAG